MTQQSKNNLADIFKSVRYILEAVALALIFWLFTSVNKQNIEVEVLKANVQSIDKQMFKLTDEIKELRQDIRNEHKRN